MLIFACLINMAAALTLPPLPAPPTQPLPIEQDGPPYTCDQVMDKLQAYNTMARQHDQSITAFLGQVSDKMSGWYALLQPLEGSSQAIPAGTFQPLQDGSDQISTLTDAALDNSALLAGEMDRILTSLGPCLKPAQKQKK